MKTDKFLVGIDPGTKTGLSIYNKTKGELTAVESGTLIEMYHLLESLDPSSILKVRIEDARKRKWFGNRSNAKAQGAGSIKRDSKLWEEICEYLELPYEMVHPIKGGTKLDADIFKKITGWQGQTNEHKRDSAMLIFGL